MGRGLYNSGLLLVYRGWALVFTSIYRCFYGAGYCARQFPYKFFTGFPSNKLLYSQG
jgi:hypothetical protein